MDANDANGKSGGGELPAIRWDVFISHASEDKVAVARPLAVLLRRAGFRVWLDESELQLGDSLRSKIDHGLANSHYGIVILSRSFFGKHWPERELGALTSRVSIDQKVIIPVWHQVDHGIFTAQSPILADKLAISTKEGLEKVADYICRTIAPIRSGTADEPADSQEQPSIHPSIVVHTQTIAPVRLTIAQMSIGSTWVCDVPLDARIDRVILKLADLLGLPHTHSLDGRPLMYFLFSKAQGQRLDEKSTLRDCNIREDEVLVLGLR